MQAALFVAEDGKGDREKDRTEGGQDGKAGRGKDKWNLGCGALVQSMYMYVSCILH